ncbi:flagella biosynthesis chaperone for FliD, FliT [Shewanella sp. AS16]|uniref:flagella biosynthesis chaperone for FliD, FliT n=1 Tax=Shewanella sp. AS16 TaxID=2907625 RepID=UPI001F3FE4A3|nr:flagella biosynthesis chaperone for FliD, FliT [Shewanella sp. AS16]MCE9686688.1 flagella biosynthesis chaperone for FliD, FliT [Shewanella sp. AS16]
MQDDINSSCSGRAHTLKTLNSLNSGVADNLAKLALSSVEDELTDMLVSNLLESIQQRQLLLAELVADNDFIDRDYLQQQLLLTQSYEQQATEVFRHRQSLVQAGSNNQRHIKVYKTIDANR